MFWEVVGLERGPLSLVSRIEELLRRKNSGSGLESRYYGRRDLSRWPRDTFYPQKLALTSLTSGGLSVGIVRSRTEAKEFGFSFAWASPVLPRLALSLWTPYDTNVPRLALSYTVSSDIIPACSKQL
jgi:hypothetical protein